MVREDFSGALGWHVVAAKPEFMPSAAFGAGPSRVVPGWRQSAPPCLRLRQQSASIQAHRWFIPTAGACGLPSGPQPSQGAGDRLRPRRTLSFHGQTAVEVNCTGRRPGTDTYGCPSASHFRYPFGR